MTLGQYVSPAHLRQFSAPSDSLIATRKSDLQSFRCAADNVCRLDASVPAIDADAADFLRQAAAQYDAALARMRSGRVDADCIVAIAGFAAGVMSLAPTALRLHEAPLEAMIATGPASAAGATGAPGRPRAVSLGTLQDRIALWGNSRWEMLLNSDPATPFFTSDYPIALEARDQSFANWIVPLAPDLAVRVFPDLRLRRTRPDFSFTNFAFRQQTPRRSDVVEINRLIVRSAEDLVLYGEDRPWIADFIAKNRHYRIEAVPQRVPYGDGYFNTVSQRIVERAAGTPA